MISMDFPGGSSGTIVYTSEGSPGLGKEYVEVHTGGISLALDDFRVLDVHRDGHRRRIQRRKRDKGHVAQFECLKRTLEGGGESYDLNPLDTMAWTLLALESATTGRAVHR
jgi:hypothetical protein